MCQYQLSIVWCVAEKHHWWEMMSLMRTVCRCPVYVVASKEFCVSCLVDWDLAPATVPTISVPCVILQLPDQLHQSRLSSHPARPITGQSSYHLTLAFTVSELSLVWSLVMGDYSIPGSHSVCVTGESFSHLSPSLPPCLPVSPLGVLLSHKLQILLSAVSSIKYQQVEPTIL